MSAMNDVTEVSCVSCGVFDTKGVFTLRGFWLKHNYMYTNLTDRSRECIMLNMKDRPIALHTHKEL